MLPVTLSRISSPKFSGADLDQQKAKSNAIGGKVLEVESGKNKFYIYNDAFERTLEEYRGFTKMMGKTTDSFLSAGRRETGPGSTLAEGRQDPNAGRANDAEMIKKDTKFLQDYLKALYERTVAKQ